MFYQHPTPGFVTRLKMGEIILDWTSTNWTLLFASEQAKMHIYLGSVVVLIQIGVGNNDNSGRTISL